MARKIEIPEHTGSVYHFLSRTERKWSEDKRSPSRANWQSHRQRKYVKLKRERVKQLKVLFKLTVRIKER